LREEYGGDMIADGIWGRGYYNGRNTGKGILGKGVIIADGI
jgi:hypothetical protein